MCSQSQLLYNFRERRFVLVHLFCGGSLVVAFHTRYVRLSVLRGRRCRSGRHVGSSVLDCSAATLARRCSQSVGRAAQCATFVRGGLRSRPLFPGPQSPRVRQRQHEAPASEKSDFGENETAIRRCRNLAHLTVLMPRSKKLRRCAIWRRTTVRAERVP